MLSDSCLRTHLCVKIILLECVLVIELEKVGNSWYTRRCERFLGDVETIKPKNMKSELKTSARESAAKVKIVFHGWYACMCVCVYECIFVCMYVFMRDREVGRLQQFGWFGGEGDLEGVWEGKNMIKYTV